MEELQRVSFRGRAGPFFLMQLGRSLLTLLTLGFHRFWWRTANRRRLWEETSIDGQPLDYRGRGIELLLGFAIAFLLVLVPLTLLSLLSQFLGASGRPLLAGAASLLYGASLLFLFGFAIYRSRRYLLSRTAWQGIRGGMVANGVAYGWLWFRLALVQFATLGLATPYVSARRWNALWNDSRFGTQAFAASLEWRPLMRPFLTSFLLAVLLVLPAVAALIGLAISMPEMAPVEGVNIKDLPAADQARVMTLMGVFFIGLPLAILLWPLAFVPWRAAFTRAAVGATRLGPVSFAFPATGGDWLRYLLGNAALVILTLGVGVLLLPFRQWDFWTRHIRISGTLDEAMVRQSRDVAPAHGDGLADVLDIGGI
ncbi:DUF898 family protein [Thermaurantiacus sp.]